MADLYASPLGTCVLQSKAIPDIVLESNRSRDGALWNATPYDVRGWCIFEQSIALESVSRSLKHPEMKAAMDAVGHAKVYEISNDVPVEPDYKQQGVRAVLDSIEKSRFTGPGDKPLVTGLYKNFHKKIARAGLYVFGSRVNHNVLAGDLTAIANEP
jgi:hypothetical protein